MGHCVLFLLICYSNRAVVGFHVWLDLPHCGNSGALAYVLASVLVELVQGGALIGRKRKRMDTLWAMIATTYDENGVDRNRITFLEESMLGATIDFPILRTNAIANKYILPTVHLVCRQRSTGTDHDKMRVQCLEQTDLV